MKPRDFWYGLVCFTASCVISDSTLSAMLCNGYAELCSKRYSEVTYAVTHNSVSTLPGKLLLGLGFGNVQNQTKTLNQQWEDGIRGMKIPFHTYGSEIFACHGIKDSMREAIFNRLCGRLGLLSGGCRQLVGAIHPCWHDPAALKARDVLSQIKNFLETHPTDILTLFIEDHIGDFLILNQLLVETQLARWVYVHRDGSPWPTLEEMITLDQRLVLFVDRFSGPVDSKGRSLSAYPGLHPFQSYIWSSRFSFKDLQDLSSDTGAGDGRFRREDLIPQPLWALQHFITAGIGGVSATAQLANQFEQIQNRIKKYQQLPELLERANSQPNYIWVDFYEAPADRGLKTLVNELNGVNSI